MSTRKMAFSACRDAIPDTSEFGLSIAPWPEMGGSNFLPYGRPKGALEPGVAGS